MGLPERKCAAGLLAQQLVAGPHKDGLQGAQGAPGRRHRPRKVVAILQGGAGWMQGWSVSGARPCCVQTDPGTSLQLLTSHSDCSCGRPHLVGSWQSQLAGRVPCRLVLLSTLQQQQPGRSGGVQQHAATHWPGTIHAACECQQQAAAARSSQRREGWECLLLAPLVWQGASQRVV